MLMLEMFELVYISPIGPIGINFDSKKISMLKFCSNLKLIKKNNYLFKDIIKQLDLYFKKKLKKFDIPYVLSGTEYQKKIFQEILKINYGKTKTYSEIANKIGSHPRPVGNACRNNPLQLIIPCHRVIGKRNIGGFLGETVKKNGNLIHIKKSLIRLEKKYIL